MSPDAAAEAARALAGERCQVTLPVLEKGFQKIERGTLDPAVATLIEAGLLVLALLAVAAVAYSLFRSGAKKRREAAAPASVEPLPPPKPPAAVFDPTLIDADRSAARGDFREALHLLLLVAIKVCAGRSGTLVPRSATSRELRASLPLGAALREGFGVLVDAVERSLFAERPVGAEEYAACRARCVELIGGRAA